jgi:hypothetical protein
VHAAFEQLPTNGVVVVDEASATFIVRGIYQQIDVGNFHSVRGFDKNHSNIAKPTGPDDLLAKWVDQRVKGDFARIADHPLTGHPRLCVKEQ